MMGGEYGLLLQRAGQGAGDTTGKQCCDRRRANCILLEPKRSAIPIDTACSSSLVRRTWRARHCATKK